VSSFNLIQENWIPVLRDGPVPERTGLLNCIREAHNISGIYHDSPLVIMSLFRLLLGILHRVYPVNDINAWSNLYNTGRFSADAIEKYFEKWKHRFFLFDELYTFYQMADHPAGDRTNTINKLTIHRAAGNNAVYNDHSYNAKNEAMPAADAALYLLVSQAFYPSGLGSKTISFQHSPFTAPMITFLRGENLFTTLLLNMVVETGFLNHGDDMPSWENPNPSKVETETSFSGYIDYLTHHSKLIKLIPSNDSNNIRVEKVCIAQGRGLPKNLTDPFGTYRIDENLGLVPIKIRPEKQLWRDYNSLINLSVTGSKMRPPLNIIQAALLKEEDIVSKGSTFSMLCGGISTDKAKILLWRLDQLPLPLNLLGDQDFINLCNLAIEHAESNSKKLYSFTRRMIQELIKYEGNEADKDEVKKLLSSFSAESYFWSALETNFKEFVITCADNPEEEDAALINWQKSCDRALSDCHEIVERAVIGSPRGPKAIAKANYFYED